MLVGKKKKTLKTSKKEKKPKKLEKHFHSAFLFFQS